MTAPLVVLDAAGRAHEHGCHVAFGLGRACTCVRSHPRGPWRDAQVQRLDEAAADAARGAPVGGGARRPP